MSIRATSEGKGAKARLQLGLLRPSSPPTMAKASQFLTSLSTSSPQFSLAGSERRKADYQRHSLFLLLVFQPSHYLYFDCATIVVYGRETCSRRR